MTRATQALLRQASRLSDHERAALAEALLASLDGPADPDRDQAWADELARREADVEAGAVELRDWREVRDSIALSLRGK